MENFFVDENFYFELSDLIDSTSFEEDLSDLEDDWSVEANWSNLEKAFTLSTDWIMKYIGEERFDEDSDTHEKCYDLLERCIDYDRINSLVPEMYYATKEKFTITKQDLLDYIKPNINNDRL